MSFEKKNTEVLGGEKQKATTKKIKNPITVSIFKVVLVYLKIISKQFLKIP